MSDHRKSRSDRLAELFDSQFKIPHTDIRFGIDPLVGLLPGVGDWIGGAISLYFLVSAALLGGKAAVLGRMFINILVDVLIGSIPILGDVFDVYWKANTRNARVLEDLRKNPKETTVASRLWVWIVLIQFIALIVGLLILIGWGVANILAMLF